MHIDREGGVAPYEKQEVRGFIQTKLKTSTPQYNFVRDLLGSYAVAGQELWRHVLISTLKNTRRYEDGWVPVSSRLMLKELTDCPTCTEDVWCQMNADSVLEVDRHYSSMQNLSREYRIPSWIFDRYHQLGERIEEDHLLTCRDLATGRKTNRNKRPEETTRLSDDNNESYPPLVDAVLRCMRNVKRRFNRRAIETHIACLEAIVDELGKKHGVDDARYKEALGKLRNDRSCWSTIKKQLPQPVKGSEDVWEYMPAVRVQEISGRLSEIGGGLQSCSREMKQASITNIERVFNFDVKSSQLYGLKQAFEEAGIDTDSVDELLAEPKEHFANRVGISVDDWKECLYAKLFHGTLHVSLKQAYCVAGEIGGELASIAKVIERAFRGKPRSEAEAAYGRLVEVLKPLDTGLQEWHEWLVSDYWEAVKKPANGWYARNDCGITFRLNEYEEGHEAKSKMAAWYLQGKEAAFIHHLILLADNYDYEVQAHEHDGLITIGEIPRKAIEEAHCRANFHYAQLEEKPFVRRVKQRGC